MEEIGSFNDFMGEHPGATLGDYEALLMAHQTTIPPGTVEILPNTGGYPLDARALRDGIEDVRHQALSPQATGGIDVVDLRTSTEYSLGQAS